MGLSAMSCLIKHLPKCSIVSWSFLFLTGGGGFFKAIVLLHTSISFGGAGLPRYTQREIRKIIDIRAEEQLLFGRPCGGGCGVGPGAVVSGSLMRSIYDIHKPTEVLDQKWLFAISGSDISKAWRRWCRP